MQQSQSIEVALCKQPDQAKKEYQIWLELGASFKCINCQLKHGLPFRGHDESEESNNRGLFLLLLEFYASDIEHVKNVVLENAPKYQQMTSPGIQKDIVHALAIETTKLITTDESRDVLVKEQMGAVLCYVDGKGCVIERFLGISHVRDTKEMSLKTAIESILMKKGEINLFKDLNFRRKPFFILYSLFRDRLQLTLVAVT
ncbi:hypothetical protein LINPERHAP2_LOCUS33636 [Linum perenne]